MSEPDHTPAFDGSQGRISIDNALRTAQQNTLQLSAMADQKASVVLGAAFVMATIVVGDLDGTNDLVQLMLLITAIGSGAAAGLALMPGSQSRAAKGHPNPLFFNGVVKMTEAEYFSEMRRVTKDDAALYQAICTDLYLSSIALGKRKFPLLRFSYQFLILGMLVTLATAVVT